jgi:signal transduction histidine kinase/CheY-like chemotaxis protein
VVTEASRVYIFENRADTERGLCAVLTHEAWDDRQCPDCVASPGLTLAYSEGLERWQEELSVGNFVVGTASNLPASEGVVMRQNRAQSLLLLPLGWEGRWRGFLGFDDVTRERPWGHEEIRVLRTACEMMGACKERARAEQQLLTAYDDLERRVEERTRDLRLANEQLQKEAAVRRRAEEDKVQLESELRQAQKIQAIGTLAGGIAHDFNNILASILGYSELALSRMETDNPYRRYFDEVLKASNRARELVQQILIFSRQSEAEKKAVFPHLIADEIVALLSASCPSNIEIRAEIDTETGAVLSSTVQMHQVVLNLCTNAQHAMRKTGGVLELRVEPRTLEDKLKSPMAELLPGDYCYISVADTGEGISAGTMERIFDPFFTTKSVHEGTGMGLAIVHGIVTGQGGAVLARSVPGVNTIFEVYLPRHAVTESEEEPEVTISPEGQERILVVDDEPQLVQLWGELLEQYGYQVTGFSDSLEALAHFREHKDGFDFVLMDQTMPGMTGTELARNILAERTDMPIIIATGFSDSVSPEIIREIGIRDLVYKPILGRDLTTAIRRVLDQTERPRQPDPA